jgi:hypothetical protein
MKENIMIKNKRNRQESAIKRLEKTLTLHEANTELTKRILEDKEKTKTSDEIEKLRQKKIERTKITIENTKKNMK